MFLSVTNADFCGKQTGSDMKAKNNYSKAERTKRSRRKTELLKQFHESYLKINTTPLDANAKLLLKKLFEICSVKSNALKVEEVESAIKQLKMLIDGLEDSPVDQNLPLNNEMVDRLVATYEPSITIKEISDQEIETVLNKRHHEWVRRYQTKLGVRVVRHNDYEYFLTDKSKIFLSEVRSEYRTPYFIVTVRHHLQVGHPWEREYSRKTNASVEINQIRSGNLSINQWRRIDHWLEPALKLVKQKMENPLGGFIQPPQTLGFILAVHEASEEILLDPGRKTPLKILRIRRHRRAILKSIGDIKLPPNSEQFDEWSNFLLEKIASSIKSDQPNVHTFRKKAWVVSQALKFCGSSSYSKLFPSISRVSKDFVDKYLKFNPTSVALKQYIEHRDVLTPDNVKVLLQIARYGYDGKLSRCGAAMFNNVIMQYATGLRVQELRILAANPSIYFVKHNGTLNFQGRHHRIQPIPVGSPQILQKTYDKVNWNEIKNPSLSLVARIIMLHDEATFECTQPDFFAKRNNPWRGIQVDLTIREAGRDTKFPTFPFKDITEACSRNTMATALMDLGIHPQTYLGHTKPTTADNHYTTGEYRVATFPISEFYSYEKSIDGTPIPNRGVWLNDGNELVNIAQYCNAWHSFLLGIYVIQKFQDCGNDEKERDRLERIFVDEAKDYWKLNKQSDEGSNQSPRSIRERF